MRVLYLADGIHARTQILIKGLKKVGIEVITLSRITYLTIVQIVLYEKIDAIIVGSGDHFFSNNEII